VNEPPFWADTVYTQVQPPVPKKPVSGRRVHLPGALILLVCVILGCMSISFGGRTVEIHDDGLLVQEGEDYVKEGTTQTVYYPIPYASTPNLEIDDVCDKIEVEEQAFDHFRIRGVPSVNQNASPVEWKANSLRGPPAGPLIVTPAATSESAKH
jgi:hypothetical protein